MLSGRKKRLVALFLFLFAATGMPAANAAEPVNAYFFYGEGCPHCAKERDFLFGEMKREYPNLKIHPFEVYYDYDGAYALQTVSEKLGVNVGGVPFLVVGDRAFVGYAEGTLSESIRARIAECSVRSCPDSLAFIADPHETGEGTAEATEKYPVRNEIPQDEGLFVLPLLGEINPADFSLPILTVIMGILDGFNPCAMWVLLFLISLLIGMENRKRMWLLGTAFIAASAAVYFMFMSAWLNVIVFLGFISWVRIMIGIVALAGGIYAIREYITNKGSGCKVVGEERRMKTFEKMRAAVGQKSLFLALGGILALAFAVNLVELVCSAGLPAVYTQVLALNDVPSAQHYLYIALYVLFFMIDDLFVFFAAMITLTATGITTKYTRFSRIVGGMLMFAIGILLIFKPEWLMFG